MFSFFKSSSNSLAGIFLNASSFGAKTVNGPMSVRVAFNSANKTAVARVERLGVAATVSTIFFNWTPKIFNSNDT